MDFGKKTSNKVMVVASGTAGHILPSKEIINELLKRGVAVDWLGYKTSLETDFEDPLLRHIQLHTQSPRTFSRLLSFSFYKNFFLDCKNILKLYSQNKYQYILLTGGFIGFLPGLFAILTRQRMFIYEQNVVLGASNNFFSWYARKIFFGLQPLITTKKTFYMGQPLRESLLKVNQKSPLEPHLLIIGGSLGSSFFNNALVDILTQHVEVKSWKITHCCGAQADPKQLTERYRQAGIAAEVFCYTDDIAKYYEQATKVIARAGAMTISELLYLKRDALLIPLPNSAGNHQVKNAECANNIKNITVCLQHEFNQDILINFLKHSCHNYVSFFEYKYNPTLEIVDQCLNYP
jgi:UDP-N-acetylglucosamine--N-acetylmuramyl-(pentapeptide) pyrophosphoryl-undecaprenol N-acetylglucosamine transferase